MTENKCPKCGNSYEHRRNLSGHFDDYPSHTPDEWFDCPSCEKSFETEQAMKSHHSQRHGESIAIETRECTVCGEEVQRSRNYEKTFCSGECRDTWQSENWSGEDNPAYSDSSVECSCNFCGETFEIWESQMDSDRGKYCSRSCKGKDKTGPDHPNWHDSSFTCVECGDEVETTPHGSETRKFCSNDCRNENMRKDNYRSYGVGWIEKRDEIRDEYNYKCAICGEEEGQNKHHVHHIIPIREFDKKENANFNENLVLLCKSHHHSIENKKYEEQAEMFNKHPR